MIHHDRYASLSDQQLQELHRTCEEFERALQHEETSSIEQCLARGAGDIQDALFAELLAIELQRQEPGDRRAQIAAYQARFPERIADIARVVRDESPSWLAEAYAPRLRTRSQARIESHFISDQPGDRIGHYKLLQPLGKGGMGVVYRAEQERPVRRQVALKIIKLGTETLRGTALFEAEAQTLAIMDHPNIVKVFDVGTTDDGRLYIAMELVSGLHITQYCDQHRLSINGRLSLYVQVCLAVQHAHQKGFIHCDLKPANIVIAEQDGVSVPKVIDFGLAETTEQKQNQRTLLTESHSLAGTPAYMSPEQADAGRVDIDTRSDIYALGILLYELLTGKPPFDGQTLLRLGLEVMLRTIRETAPPRPSRRLHELPEEELARLAQERGTPSAKLLRLVRGELDGIVMKCLEKDRARRYATASELALDIKRHLILQPTRLLDYCSSGKTSLLRSARVRIVLSRNRKSLL